jgi:CAAX prenyl protease-like protein
MTIRELRSSPAAAWAGPLLVFLCFSLLGTVLESDKVGAPLYLAHPEQWVYPLQTLVCLGLIAFWWRHYTFRPLGAGAALLAVIAGIVGIVVWILPSWLFDNGQVPEIPTLGMVSRSGDGFNPDLWGENPAAWWGAVIMRFIRMTIVVAFAEELFWRGFLWRMLSDPYRDFHQVKFAQWHWMALAVTVLCFSFAHLPADRAAAAFYALLMAGVYLKTKSVGACVLAHAVSNFILGLYVMHTRQWGFW